MVIDLGGDAVTLGSLVAAFAMTSILAAPVWGTVADRVGMRTALLFSTVGIIVANVCLGLAESIFALLVLRIFAGAMDGNIGVLTAAVIEESAPDDRTQSMVYLNAVFSAGYIAGPLVAFSASILSVDALTFWICLSSGAISGFALLLLAFYRPVSESFSRRIEPNTCKPKGGFEDPIFSLPTLLVILAIYAFCQSAVNSMVSFWGDALFGWEVRGVSTTVLLISIAVVAAKICLLPKMLECLGTRCVIFFSAILALVAVTILLFVAGRPWIFVSSLVMLYAAASALIALATALLAAQVGAKTGRIGQRLGWGVASVGVGRVAAPVVLGTVFVTFGTEGTFLALFAVVAVLAIWILGALYVHRSGRRGYAT